MTVATVAAVLAVTSGTAAGQTVAPTISFDEAIARTLENDPAVVQAAGGVETAEWAQRQAAAAYLPSLSLNTSAGMSGSNGGGDSFSEVQESYGAGVSAAVDIDTGGRRGAETDQARAESDAATSTLTERRFAAVLSTQRAYYDVARTADLVNVAQARLANAEQALSAAERRLQVGSATQSDVLRAQLEQSRSRQALLEAENAERTAMLHLGRAVGMDGPVGVEPIPEEAPEDLIGISEEELIASIAESAPTLAAASASLLSAASATRAAQSRYLPSVQLSTAYDPNSQSLGFDDGRTGWNLRLGLSLPIFDGHSRAASVSTARVRTETAEAQLADTRRGVQVEAERLLAQLRLALQQISLAEEGLRVAEEDLRVQQARYDLSTSTMLDLIASQTALTEAQQNLVGARYDLQIARAELEALAGREL